MAIRALDAPALTDIIAKHGPLIGRLLDELPEGYALDEADAAAALSRSLIEHPDVLRSIVAEGSGRSAAEVESLPFHLLALETFRIAEKTRAEYEPADLRAVVVAGLRPYSQMLSGVRH